MWCRRQHCLLGFPTAHQINNNYNNIPTIDRLARSFARHKSNEADSNHLMHLIWSTMKFVCARRALVWFHQGLVIVSIVASVVVVVVIMSSVTLICRAIAERLVAVTVVVSGASVVCCCNKDDSNLCSCKLPRHRYRGTNSNCIQNGRLLRGTVSGANASFVGRRLNCLLPRLGEEKWGCDLYSTRVRRTCTGYRNSTYAKVAATTMAWCHQRPTISYEARDNWPT